MAILVAWEVAQILQCIMDTLYFIHGEGKKPSGRMCMYVCGEIGKLHVFHLTLNMVTCDYLYLSLQPHSVLGEAPKPSLFG